MTALKPEAIFQGNGVSPGIVLGSALKIDNHNRVILKTGIEAQRVEAEVRRFQRAVQISREQLEILKPRLEEKVGHEHSYILEAHLLMLEDQSLSAEIISTIQGSRVNAEWAVRRASERIQEAYKSLEDDYFRERGSDVENVLERIILNLSGENEVDSFSLPEDLIIVSQDFSPSTFALLDLQKVKGLAMESGGRTSHTAIIARSLRLPTVMEAKDFMPAITTGDILLLDGDQGQVILNPTPERLDRMRERLEEFNATLQATATQAGVPAVTRNGTAISLRANTELPHEVRASKLCGAEGIGLFRSEFFFLAHPHGFPTMAEQLETYRMLVEEIQPYPVAIRTLDTGADKVFHGGDSAGQPNPAMGMRGIRLSLQARDLFAVQIEAILRASHYGKIEIVLPMISTVEEIWEAKKIIGEVRAELKRKSVEMDRTIPIGAMIEVPAAVLMAESLADEVDFLSVGTNDLIQYTLAVDRANRQVSYLFQPLHPSILQSLRHIAEIAGRKNKPVRICGEIASNPFFATLLLGIGFTELSMNAYSIPIIRKLINGLTLSSVRGLAERAMNCRTADEVSDYLIKSVTELVKIDLSPYVREIQHS